MSELYGLKISVAAVSLAVSLPVLLARWTPAEAGATVTESTEYYSVSGRTGMDLLKDMNRKGPRHGFLTKAIAQTRFKTDFKGSFEYRDGICRSRGAVFTLHITYIYPKPSAPLPAPLAKRWKRFHATNVQHERQHGRIARKMAAAIGRKLDGFKVADRYGCRRPTAQLDREIEAIIEAHNREQEAFDEREHRDGGPVDRSVMALIR